MKKNYIDPYYWAAFICQGNPAPLLIQTSNYFFKNNAIPTTTTALLNRGMNLGKLGNHDEAISFYDRVIELDPNNMDTWNSKILALKKLGRTEEANKCFSIHKILSGQIV
jgi:tetratricopeptide (TPR) repeat protein